MMTTGMQLQAAQRMRRVMRRPQHTFQLRYRPWQIQPFMIAPVLPGETMKNLLLQARVVTDPIKNPLIGWWNEYYFFYVKHRDLYDRDLFTEMMLNPEANLSALDSATKVEHYHTNGTPLAIDWVKLCMERVVDEYFRHEGEDNSQFAIGNLPAAGVNVSNYLDSAVNEADFVTPGDETILDAATSDTLEISEVDAAMRRYELMRYHGLTDMTYEDYLATYGVKPQAQELHKPELIRFIKDWSYPTNTVLAQDVLDSEDTVIQKAGTPTSAVSWVISERADKDRAFREPGFIFGVTVTRPKVYMRGLTTAAVQVMSDAYSWLPQILSADPYASMKKVAAGEPPLDLNTDAYWIDVKDILLYGDQFINFALDATDANIIDLPTAALIKRYADSDDANSLFVDETANLVKADGIVSLSVAGRQTDTSMNSVGTNITV